MKKKMIALTAALVLVLSAAVVGTVAWLTDKTTARVNTFTVGNITIDLTETTTDYKMTPAKRLRKTRKFRSLRQRSLLAVWSRWKNPQIWMISLAIPSQMAGRNCPALQAFITER